MTMILIYSVCATVFLFLCVSIQVALAEDSPPVVRNSTSIAFVNVNVVPMDSERILTGQTVIVRGDRISEIGPVDTIDIPGDAQRIDGSGKYLMPGLVDMHIHLWNESELALFIPNGVTTVRNMWGTEYHLKLREEIKEGKHVAPTLFTTGPIIDGNPPLWGSSVAVETPEQARQVVADNKAAGYDLIKTYDGLSVEIYDALMEAAAKHGMPVAGHPTVVGIEHALAAGQHSVEHLFGYEKYLEGEDSPFFGQSLWNRRPESIVWRHSVAWQYMDERKIPGIARATREAGTWNCVTLVVHQKIVMTREQRKQELELPYMKYVPMSTKQGWLSSKATIGGERLREWLGELRGLGISLEECLDAHFRNGKKMTKALHDAGARIVLGTDALNPLVLHGFSVHQELQYLVDAGLTPYEAVKAGTRDAAECLGELDEFGTINVGLRADLLLVDGNPLVDVGNADKRVGVMLRGHWLPQSELQFMLDAVAAKHTMDENSDGVVLHGRWYSRGHLERIVDERHRGRLVERTLSSNRIFLTGSGDSEPVARASATKLTQAGIQAYVVGDETTPAMEKDDQLIAISLSGSSEVTEKVAWAAKKSKARVALLTGASESWIRDISNLSFLLKPDSPRADFDKAVEKFIDKVIALITEKRE
ncbi:amidohydrolase family protein [Candidatus Poribacteria bacterium]